MIRKFYHSIITADRINGRYTVKMQKLLYMQQYSNIEDGSLKDFTGKHGILFVQTTRRVITCTVKALQQKLNEKFQLDLSIGTIIALK